MKSSSLWIELYVKLSSYKERLKYFSAILIKTNQKSPRYSVYLKSASVKLKWVLKGTLKSLGLPFVMHGPTQNCVLFLLVNKENVKYF